MIINVNALLGRWTFWTLRYGGVEGVLALMERAGIDRAVVTSMNSVFHNREKTEKPNYSTKYSPKNLPGYSFCG